MFNNEDGVYEKGNMRSVNDARMGNYAEWNSMYSEGWTEVMGFIDPVFTSPVFGMGACEKRWGVTNRIKSDHHANITGVNTEKLSIISTTPNLNKEITNCETLYELEYKDTN